MIVAVLGANGQLGSDIVRIAREFPHVETLGLTRKDLDVCELASIPEVLSRKQFDVLVNCTSYHKTDEVEGRATQAFLTNAHAVGTMARTCKARGGRFVHVSTDYVFGGESKRPYTEADPPNPINVYGASKLLGENVAVREYADGILIARVASLFGVAGSSGKGGNFVETILRKAKVMTEVPVVNDITMSPTFSADAARVILTLVEKEAPVGIYHIVNSGSATWFEFAQEIVKRTGMRVKIVPTTSAKYPTVAIRPAYTALDNQKAAQIVGEIPDWRGGLHRYLLEKDCVQLVQSGIPGD